MFITYKKVVKKVKVLVDVDPVRTNFFKWCHPGWFRRVLVKRTWPLDEAEIARGYDEYEFWGTSRVGNSATKWYWNLHALSHDFDTHSVVSNYRTQTCVVQHKEYRIWERNIQNISRKVFRAHFGQLGIIFLWLSGMYYHGASFSNYVVWLKDPVHIKPSRQLVWPIVGQEILNGDVGGGCQGIQITSGLFQIWRGRGITSELQLYRTAVGGLLFSFLIFIAGWLHFHRAAPRHRWFQNAESIINHHLAGLLGLGSLRWAGHQIHIAIPINYLLDSEVDPKEIPLPHEWLFNLDMIKQLYPSFAKGLEPFFHSALGCLQRFFDFSRWFESSKREAVVDRSSTSSFGPCSLVHRRRSHISH
jgi:photosystem I P700 chlorophyll a apoprotein A1